jgi:hypothetical protein
MSIGREGAICEYIEIMQIPPRFERRRGAYRCVAGDLQYGERRAQSMIRKSMPSGRDPMGGYRFSEKIMLKQKDRAG